MVPEILVSCMEGKQPAEDDMPPALEADLRVHLDFMRASGVWPLRDMRPAVATATRTLQAILGVFVTLLFMGEWIYVAIGTRTILDITHGLSVACLRLEVAWKLLYAFARRDTLRAAISELSHAHKLGVVALGDAHEGALAMIASMRPWKRQASRICIAWVSLAVYGGIFWALVPVGMHLFSAGDNSTTFDPLPLPAWHPFDISVSPTYELVYLFELIAIAASCLVLSSFDQFFVGMVMVLGGHFQYVVDALKQVSSSGVSEEEQRVRLAGCIKYHQALLRVTRNFNSFFSPLVFLQSQKALVSMCISAFEASVVRGYGMDLVSVVQYFVLLTVQFGIYCVAATKLTSVAADVQNAVYGIDWPAGSRYLAGCGRVLIQMAQQPVQMHGGPFYSLSMVTLVALMRLSFSYFTVLREVSKHLVIE